MSIPVATRSATRERSENRQRGQGCCVVPFHRGSRSGGHCQAIGTREAQFRSDDRQLGSIGRVFLENDVPDTGVPYFRQMVGALAGDYDEPLRIRRRQGQICEQGLIDDDYAIQLQVRLIHHINPMHAVPQQKIAQQLGVIRIMDRELDCFHVQIHAYAYRRAIRKPVEGSPQMQ